MSSLVIIFLLLLAASAFFSGSETALFSLSKVQLHRFRELARASTSRLLEALRRPRDTLVTILLGNELVNVSISIVGAAFVSRVFERQGVEVQTLLAIAIITPLLLIFGEILPKNVALRYAPQLAPMLIMPLGIFHRAVSPLRYLLTGIADRIIRLFGGDPATGAPMIMEEEFRRLVDLGRKEGVIVEEEREIIHNVFEFSDKAAGDIMTPAERLFMLPIDLPYEALMEEVKSTQYSRVPFYEGERENVIGILHVRDLFSFEMKRRAGVMRELRDLLRPPLAVHQRLPLEELLREFQRVHMHMALVKDDGGRVRGVVTLDDVQMELFGEIEE